MIGNLFKAQLISRDDTTLGKQALWGVGCSKIKFDIDLSVEQFRSGHCVVKGVPWRQSNISVLHHYGDA
jgi:hypothetical protein